MTRMIVTSRLSMFREAAGSGSSCRRLGRRYMELCRGAVSPNGCRSSARPSWPGHAGPLGRERPSAERHIFGARCGERRAHRAEQDARCRTAACSRVHGTRDRATGTCRAPRCPYRAPVSGALAAGLTARGTCRFATGPDLIAGEPAAVAAAWSANGGLGSWRLTAARFVVLRDDAELRIAASGPAPDAPV